MFSFLKSSNMVQQATKTWRLLFNQTFCCRVRADGLFAPKRNLSYATFDSNNNDDSDDVLSSYGDHDDEIIVKKLSRPTSIEGLKTASDDPQSKPSPCHVITSQPIPHLTVTSAIRSNSSTPLLSPQNGTKCFTSASFSTDTFKTSDSIESECASSGISSGTLTQPSSMEFSDTLETELTPTTAKAKDENPVQSVDDTPLVEILDTNQNEAQVNCGARTQRNEAGTGDFESVFSDRPPVNSNEKGFKVTETNDELLRVVEESETALDVLGALERHAGSIIPLLGVACIHFIYLKALAQYERNSPEYKELCGVILTNPTFRSMLLDIEYNVQSLNNFALLTTASDLLYLRITLRKPTISTLLSHVDYESLNIVELRLLASCLHTPNIPIINADYVYNVAGSIAMRLLHEITDLYTLLSIMKCFGRYFTSQAKRQADVLMSNFVDQLHTTYPDGRLTAPHMFDAFYRMEYAPSRPLQLAACRAINSSSIPLQPQDVSAVLRYFVKYGYNLEQDGHVMLNKISDVLYRNLEKEPVAKCTTNIKWISVFYYYNQSLMDRYIATVRRDMAKLDFVALSDVLDTMAQIYYLPDDADSFFDQLHGEMVHKYPTLQRSNVKNVQRKLLFTAHHFAVFGRYPETIIKLTLNPNQMTLNQNVNKHFLREFCESVRIERPDLLPQSLPPFGDLSFTTPKMYAFEKDVRFVLAEVVGHRKFTFTSSPVRGLPVFVLRQQLDGSILTVQRNPPGFIPPHHRQTVHNVAVVPLPRSRFCIGSRHAVGKTRHALRLIRAQGARVITVPHFDWDGHSFEHKAALLSRKIFEQRTDDVID